MRFEFHKAVNHSARRLLPAVAGLGGNIIIGRKSTKLLLPLSHFPEKVVRAITNKEQKWRDSHQPASPKLACGLKIDCQPNDEQYCNHAVAKTKGQANADWLCLPSPTNADGHTDRGEYYQATKDPGAMAISRMTWHI